MSSAISTEQSEAAPRQRLPGKPRRDPDDSLQPWQFFVLAGLACATVLTFLARGQGLVQVVLFTVLMGTTVLVGLAALRAVRPLLTREEDRTAMIGHRTRAALEREKMLVLRSIKELEFDRAMGKLSDADWQEMSTRLRARATGLMRQLDAGGYRGQIERDLEKLLAGMPESTGARRARADARTRSCPSCETANDADAKFCKSCGTKL
jgi:hypothetical protein